MDRSVNAVRKTFIDFFVAKKHAFIPSSPSAPLDDPTLLFTNAGMNKFKPLFLGQADPTTDFGRLKRAANSQKCIRAGGKHNDLDDVGRDTYHHTFFEMLGNWSFGDYFKKEAIQWSFELLTKVYGMSPDRLYATYFQGEPKAGLEPDLESKNLWDALLPKGHVIPGNMKDNFWEMGDTGPCGPCSEIHFDRIGDRDASKLVNAGDPDVLEIWNNVFIQYNREESGTLKELPAKHVDTGMGLERLVSCLQNVRSNYDTDVFMPLFVAIERATGARPYMGRLAEQDQGNIDTAYRVIADHIRTLTFAITDGALPSNVGRGYVLRRILRRAVRYGRQMLNAKPGFFSGLVPVVVENFGDAFPELRNDPARVQAILMDEEDSFGRTLDRGIKLFEKVASEAKGLEIPGIEAFRLYDTFGFPIDLTALMANERGMIIDMDGYERERSKAEEMSRTGGKVVQKQLALEGEQVARLRALNIEPTDDSAKFDLKDVSAHVRAIWNGSSFDDRIKPGIVSRDRMVGIVLDRTSYYAEMGGQEGDTGKLQVISESRSNIHDRHDGGEFVVESTRAFGGYVLHIGHVAKGELRVGDTVSAEVNKFVKIRTQSNHTSTHIANFALRKVLGDHVDQKGSLVAPDRMRFDFVHPHPVSIDELAKVEAIVRSQIKQDLTVYAEPASLATAKSISGLRAVFGEAYPDPVRVVAIGESVKSLLDNPANLAWAELSAEFCGGSHVQSTALIGAFAITAEEAVAKGVRRISALTGDMAENAIAAADAAELRVERASRLSDTDLAALIPTLLIELDQATMPQVRKAQIRTAIGVLQERAKQAGKKLADAVRDKAVREAGGIADQARNLNDNVVVSTVEAGEDRAALQAACKHIRDVCPRAAVMLFSIDQATGKVGVCAMVPQALIAKGLKAGDWLRDTCALLGGKGGGKPDSAQGGGADASNLKEAITQARKAAFKVVM